MHLLLDAHTIEDLQLFSSDADVDSVFNFCNRCRTEGGERALRRRMEAPWACAGRIRATQLSLSFIIEHRDAFTQLPSAYLSLAVERYAREVLPIIRQQNLVEFSLAAFFFWAREDRFYGRIVRGVGLTLRLIRSLRQFASAVRGTSPEGELAVLLEEMQTLLNRPLVAAMPEVEAAQWFWQKLRIDQTLRLHEKASIERLLQIRYELDALEAMAEVTSEHGFVLPTIECGPVHVAAVGLVHPFVTNAVANPLDLNQVNRVLFLTGPNMAGKTTYLRAVATALYLAHLGMGVPAQRFAFVPVECLLTSISLSDSLNDGISYFRAEALRVKAVAEAVAQGLTTVAIMDEPFKGTNVKDAFDASLAVLQRLATTRDCLVVVSSHLIELGEWLSNTAHVDYRYFEAQEQADRLRFDYVLHTGISSQRLGMRVLREEGVFDLLDGIPQQKKAPE